jgi:hypothetical protein
MASKRNRSRKSLAVALAIVGVAGLSMASAAQLNVTSDTVAAGVSVVGSCQPSGTPVNVGYVTTFTAGVYNVSSVTVTGLVSACVGKSVELSLMSSATGAAIGGTGVVTATASPQTIALLAPVSALSVTNIAVVIH